MRAFAPTRKGSIFVFGRWRGGSFCRSSRLRTGSGGGCCRRRRFTHIRLSSRMGRDLRYRALRRDRRSPLTIFPGLRSPRNWRIRNLRRLRWLRLRYVPCRSRRRHGKIRLARLSSARGTRRKRIGSLFGALKSGGIHSEDGRAAQRRHLIGNSLSSSDILAALCAHTGSDNSRQ